MNAWVAALLLAAMVADACAWLTNEAWAWAAAATLTIGVLTVNVVHGERP